MRTRPGSLAAVTAADAHPIRAPLSFPRNAPNRRVPLMADTTPSMAAERADELTRRLRTRLRHDAWHATLHASDQQVQYIAWLLEASKDGTITLQEAQQAIAHLRNSLLNQRDQQAA